MPPPISEIVPVRLYLGAIQNARDHAALQQLQITHAVNCAANRYPQVLDGSGVAHVLDIMLADSPTADIQHHFELCVAFINDALASGGRVLVFCHAGQSRSATMVLAFLMQHGGKEGGLSLKEAFGRVHAARPIIYPNPGFRKALFELEAAVRGAQVATAGTGAGAGAGAGAYTASATDRELLIKCLTGKGLTMASRQRLFTAADVEAALEACQAEDDPEYSASYALQLVDQKEQRARILQARRQTQGKAAKRHKAD